MGKVIQLRERNRSRYKARLDAAYADMSDAFLRVLQRRGKDDALVHAMVKLTADLVAIGSERAECGEVWRETMIQAFEKRVRKPMEPPES